MVVLVLVFTAGITVCFIAAMIGNGSADITMDPAFVPDKNVIRQVIYIAFISPWAFIGFESVTNSTSEFKFKQSKLFRVLLISLIVTTALYIFIILMSTSAYPEGCSSWFDYISRLDEFEGIAGLPAFYAANHYMGSAGVYILMASLLALVLTSLIGVLLDLQMPRMGGMEVLKVMREEDEFKDIRVLVMTADQSAEIEFLKIGATDFIPKPYPEWDVIGTQVRSVARKIGGVAARRGADTFLIYCLHRDEYGSILEQASESIAGDDKSASNRVRLRMGVYACVDKALEIERRFDYAMIAANSVKNGYNKSIGFYDEKLREAELYRERLLEDFKDSLDNGHFAVFFQPKFDIRPEKPSLASAEALVRWKHPELGMISPAVFIPLLEDNGLILELDKFVWSKTAETIRGWKDRFGYSVPVSVNVSRIDMLTPDLKRILKQILDNYSLDTNDLILEITESAYTGDSEQIISTAKDLRGMGMGFRIEMDDFGTGYSSLGMLTTLPIDALKLDMSFVRSAFGEVRDVRMIELIIDVADYIRVPVVAEGVETEEQYKVLKTMGCDVVQGYYFSKPVPAEDFERFPIERSKEKAEITPKAKKTYINLSKALAGNFENIFYVDLVTNFYLEFKSSKDGDLEILPGGQNFFSEMQEKFLPDVCGEDQTSVRNALDKNNLIRWIEKEETVSLPFEKMKNGKRTPYILQTIRIRSSDDHHVVIGVKPE